MKSGNILILPLFLWVKLALTNKRILRKAEFWQLHKKISINERQRKVLNMQFDNFEGKLQSSKLAKINKISSDTALRVIKI